MSGLLRKTWAAWKKAALRIARFQTALVLTLLYFAVLAPLGLLLRLFGWDPLQVGSRHRKRATNWKEVRVAEPELDSMRRQSQT
ncbi:MAG: hypothetical protein KAW91_06905 [candidate division Zixibacteria bacterium]|nr:hypothetical protein [candidate division Zixibacteria bacterium]MCK4606655.1 hypothetical protein [candidate division Zixibacteria bacterium]